MIRLAFLLTASLTLTACDFEQFTKNLEGRSSEGRVIPASTAFYSAPVELTVAAAIEPEPVAVVIPPPEPEPVCVPVFRVVTCEE